jgi:hypothetical protein
LGENIPDLADAEVLPIIITPCTFTTKGAVPSLRKVRYWHLEEFRSWAKQALHTLRDLRREFPGPGSLTWRNTAAERLKSAKIAPAELAGMLKQTAAEAMKVVAGKEEVE